MVVLVTGATGFVGGALVEKLSTHPAFFPRAAVRHFNRKFSPNIDTVMVRGLDPDANWSKALKSIDVVVHLAGRAHVLKEVSPTPLENFRNVNVLGTLNLARQAVAAGVQRFVFISSIGVNGNKNDRPFTENDTLHPVEPYAVSKMETEQSLQKLSETTGIELVIIRPPLVYGPNAPGNFGRLLRVVEKGIPLPLGSINNKRSLIALDNLVDLITTCIDHPAATNNVFLAGDGEDLSTTELLKLIGKSLGKPVRLIPVPVKLLELGAALLGKQALIQRLCNSLQVDISKARTLLGWKPPIDVEEGILRTAHAFLRIPS